MLTSHFRFHALLNFQVRSRSSRFARAIRSVMGQYLTTAEGSGGSLDFRLDFIPGKSDIRECEILDGRYYVRRNFMYFANRYKIARWFVEINGIEEAESQVRIWGNPFSAFVFPYETVMDIIRLKLMRKGFVPLHGLAVEKNGGAHLLLGRSGIGKTILARKLSAKGFRIISDDTVFINGLGEVAGFLQPVGLRFTYDVERVLGYRLLPSERMTVLGHRLLKLFSAGWFTLFLKADPVRLFGPSASAPIPLHTVVVAIQGPGPRDFAPLDIERATDSAMLSARMEMVETLKLFQAYNYAFPDNPLNKAMDDQRGNLRASFGNAAIYSANFPEVFDDATLERVEEAFSAA